MSSGRGGVDGRESLTSKDRTIFNCFKLAIKHFSLRMMLLLLLLWMLLWWLWWLLLWLSPRLSVIIGHHQSSSVIISHHWSSVINHHRSSSVISHQSSLVIISHHQSSSLTHTMATRAPLELIKRSFSTPQSDPSGNPL